MPPSRYYRGPHIAPMFRGKIPTGLVRSYFGRHQIKKKGTPTGLSPVGEKMSETDFLADQPTGRKYRITTSANPRAFHTARIGAEMYRKYGGVANLGVPKAKEGRGRVLREISLEHVLPGEKLDRYEAIMKGIMAKNKRLNETTAEELLLVNWMNGKYTSEIGDAVRITDDLIYLTFGLGQTVAQGGRKNIELRNVSHSGFVEMVFMRLTGRDFRTTGSGMVNPGEGLTVHFLPNGKAVLEYRNRRYDVTKNLEKSIAQTRSRFK